MFVCSRVLPSWRPRVFSGLHDRRVSISTRRVLESPRRIVSPFLGCVVEADLLRSFSWAFTVYQCVLDILVFCVSTYTTGRVQHLSVLPAFSPSAEILIT